MNFVDVTAFNTSPSTLTKTLNPGISTSSNVKTTEKGDQGKVKNIK